jgi:hypothetical protein
VNPAVKADWLLRVLNPDNPDQPEIIEISMTKTIVSGQQTPVSMERLNISLVDSESLPFLKGWINILFSGMTSRADFE